MSRSLGGVLPTGAKVGSSISVMSIAFRILSVSSAAVSNAPIPCPRCELHTWGDRRSLMTIYNFSLLISQPTVDEETAADRLYAGGCDDALFSVSGGVYEVEFDREASSLVDAVRSACVFRGTWTPGSAP